MKLRTLIFTFALALLAQIVTPAGATTYYVRTDGGDATQCTGLANAAYPGSGSGVACAWKNPQYAIPPGYIGDGTPAPRIAAGDTLVISPGTYPMGYGTPGAESCKSNYTYACVLDAYTGRYLPNNITITGANGGLCPSMPVLWGSGHQQDLIDVTNTSGITISCLELTDHATCTEWNTNYKAGVVAICSNSPPTNLGAQDGIEVYNTPTGPSPGTRHTNNLILTNVYIHGFTHDGIHVGGLTGTTILDHVEICCNAESGWDGDIGEGGTSSNSGTILIKNSGIDWNGCSENYPAVGTMATCVAAEQGGYGDGLGTYATGGNWRFINDHFLHNTSDGLDLLYADGTGSVFVDRVTSEFNLSQQVKVNGPGTVQNSVINGDCSEFTGMGPVPAERCRALGNAVELDNNAANQTLTFQNNTVTGNGDCLIDSGPGSGAVGGFDPVSSDVLNIKSNILLGQVSYLGKNGGAYTCGFYTSGVPTVNFTSNILWHYRNNTCGNGLTCVDPLLKNETGASFDATPLTGSPALGATTACTTVDWGSQTRGNPCTIGAIETTTTPQQPNYTGN